MDKSHWGGSVGLVWRARSRPVTSANGAQLRAPRLRLSVKVATVQAVSADATAATAATFPRSSVSQLTVTCRPAASALR